MSATTTTTTTAKVKVTAKTPYPVIRDGEQVIDQVGLQFHADYADGRNAEWAKYTPTLSLTMTVRPEVADRFLVGAAFTLTFTPEES